MNEYRTNANQTPYFTKDRVERKWYVVDMADQVLGRAAVGIAKLIIGKNHAQFTPGQDTGAFVVVLNADKLRVTGNKLTQKIYYRHSGYPGGLRATMLRDRLSKDAREVVRDAVKGMLPHNKLGNRLITKLKVYSGSDHPHTAQNPTVITVEELAKL
ncbi:50S ribosomal protein L13 [bacterium]|nr:50S ribosomal protein L13 [bacterium]